MAPLSRSAEILTEQAVAECSWAGCVERRLPRKSAGSAVPLLSKTRASSLSWPSRLWLSPWRYHQSSRCAARARGHFSPSLPCAQLSACCTLLSLSPETAGGVEKDLERLLSFSRWLAARLRNDGPVPSSSS